MKKSGSLSSLPKLVCCLLVLFIGTIACDRKSENIIQKEGFLTGAVEASLHYRLVGSSGDTLVILHGGPGAGMHSFLPSVKPLTDDFVLLLYDQRGGGRSELPADSSKLKPEFFVEDLESVRQHFGLKQMKVVTHSFGSVLLAEYAAKYPHRLDRIVFHGSTGPVRTQMGEYYQARARLTAPLQDTSLSNRSSRLLQELLQGTAEDPVAACREYEDVSRQIAIARGETVNYTGTTCNASAEAVRYYYRYTAQLAPMFFGNWDYTYRLDSLKAPLLVMYGEQDFLAISSQREWTQIVPDARLLLVPGAGKAALSDNPDFALEAITKFMNGRWPEGAVPSDRAKSMVDAAKEFRARLASKRYEDARSMMSVDARRWWEKREGMGEPWNVGENSGPWAEWDRHFRTENEVLEWKTNGNAVTAVIRETNDYFQLLERGWVRNEITYYFNGSGEIEGLLIRAAGDRPPGRTDEFLSWADEHHPEELRELMPDGEIDPSGDHPQRFRTLLNLWRISAGLDPIE